MRNISIFSHILLLFNVEPKTHQSSDVKTCALYENALKMCVKFWQKKTFILDMKREITRDFGMRIEHKKLEIHNIIQKKVAVWKERKNTQNFPPAFLFRRKCSFNYSVGVSSLCCVFYEREKKEREGMGSFVIL